MIHTMEWIEFLEANEWEGWKNSETVNSFVFQFYKFQKESKKPWFRYEWFFFKRNQWKIIFSFYREDHLLIYLFKKDLVWNGLKWSLWQKEMITPLFVDPNDLTRIAKLINTIGQTGGFTYAPV